MKLPPDGFLSPELLPWIESAKASAPEWFTLVHDVNRSAVAILPTLEPKRASDKELMATAIYARALQTFEGAVLLAERGMLADAGTLARSVVETTIYLGGLAVINDFPKQMAADSNKHFFKMGTALAELLEKDDDAAAADEAAELRDLLQSSKGNCVGSKSIVIRELAKEVGMDTLFEVVYRQLSGDSAHPTVTTCNRHLVHNQHGVVEKLTFQPQRAGLENILTAALTAMLGAMEAISRVFERADIEATVNIYIALLNKIEKN